MKCYRRINRIRWDQKSVTQEEHGATDHGQEAKPVWTHMDNRLVREFMFGMMEAETRRGRKTMQRMVRRHQGMVQRRNPHTQHDRST